jgi:phospholipid-binding lipoprotein MlaA
VVVVNDLLQMRPAKAAASVARLAINLTAGLLGTIDMATRVGVPYHPNGFGDTLGRYGVGPGPYIFLPLLGPSDVRDLFGAGVDVASTPLFYIAYPYKTDSNITVAAVGGLATRAEADSDLTALMSDAADPYATLRSTYLQSRQGEIDDKQVLPALPDMGDPATPPTPSAANGLVADVRLDHAQAFETLPDQQGRDADGQVAAALEQGQGQGKIGSEAEEGAEQDVGALLDADAHGGDEGGAAHRADQALDGQD